jgi:hypothetical protein
MLTLRKGSWVTLNSVTSGTTPDEVRVFMAEAGVYLTLDEILITEHLIGRNTYAQVIISLRNSEISNLVERAIGPLQLNGSSPHVVHKEPRVSLDRD